LYTGADAAARWYCWLYTGADAAASGAGYPATDASAYVVLLDVTTAGFDAAAAGITKSPILHETFNTPLGVPDGSRTCIIIIINFLGS
jgi:hypothetical protein